MNLSCIFICCDLLSENCIFDLINNADVADIVDAELWFAFRKLYLWLDKQLTFLSPRQSRCCDLLSENCIFDLINNKSHLFLMVQQLWFAFRKLYLWLDKQLFIDFFKCFASCDLLSENCIFDLINNVTSLYSPLSAVVICFQKIVSLTW